MSLRLCQIAELAAHASARSSLIIEGGGNLPEHSLRHYWQHSRLRNNAWIRELDSLTNNFGNAPLFEHQQLWQQAEVILTEVFVTEILTRVWAAVMTAHDRRRFRQIAEPIARHTLNGHLEARHRAMILMVSGPNIPLTEIARVDRVRRKSERWTDLLLGSFVMDYGLSELAFDVTRSLDFAQTQLKDIVRASDAPVSEFILAGMRLAFRDVSSGWSETEAANRQLMKAVMGSFPPDIFDEFGQMKSSERVRAERGSLLETPLFGRHAKSNSTADKNRQRISFTDLRLKQRDE